MILVASYSSGMGGAERLLVEFVSALDGERCLACPEGPLASAARRAGLRVMPLRARSPVLRGSPAAALAALRGLAGHALELRRLAGDLDPDAVIAWGMRPLLACALAGLARTGAPPLVFQHNDLLPGALTGRLVRAAAGRTALVLALSHAIANELDAGDRVQVVHPGLDVGSFEGGATPASPPEVLVLGALVGWKRPDLALEAFATVHRSVPQARLRFVGAPLEGGDAVLDHARTRAARPDLAGAVEFAGPVADARRELARATCLLHCAEREPFGLVVLEALAAGRPVVFPAAAGPGEIADESCGVPYPPGDARVAADALVRLLSEPERAAEMGERGRARVRRCFDRDRARARWAQAVKPVRRHRPGRAPAGQSLALVTVTHNSAATLPALLHSAAVHLPGARVVVVDCASSDGTLSLAGSATTIALNENVGFGRGCNIGVAAVDELVTVLVNPDVELLDDSLSRLAAEAMRRDRPERLLAPRVLYPDGSRQDSVHPLPTSRADLVRSLLPPAVVLGAATPWRARRPRRVGWAVGCALAARTETLRRLGPFDEQIFLYGEDLDLALRAGVAGVQTWFWPQARVLHRRHHATAEAFGGEAFGLLAQTRHDVVARRLGPRRARVDHAAQALTFSSRVIAKRLLGRPAERERRQLQALRELAERP